MKLSWSPRARGDIREIHTWIAHHDRSAATRVVAAIRNTANIIARHPGLGRATDRPRYRVIGVVRYPYLVYFTVEHEEVVILHVRHAARDVPADDIR